MALAFKPLPSFFAALATSSPKGRAKRGVAAPLSLPATSRAKSPTSSLNDLKADFARDHVRDANPSPRVAALAMSSPREANLVEEEAALPALKMSKTLGAADMPAPAQSPSQT